MQTSISLVVGVCAAVVEEEAEGEEPSRRRHCRLEGLPCEERGCRWDLRFVRSIMDIAQASRSTGVRLAAWMKASDS